MSELVTNKYKRDDDSKALLAKDKAQLRKHLKQKELVNTIKDQEQYINTLEERMNNLENIVKEIQESKEKIESVEKE